MNDSNWQDPILEKFGEVRYTGNDQYVSICPAHDDLHASLSLKVTDEVICIHCHAGCRAEDVLKEVGLQFKDLYKPKVKSRDKPKREIEAVYPYFDADYELLFQVVRTKPKGFFQRRPDRTGGWINNLEGVETIPYRLPELIYGVKNGKIIFIAEGEKDVHTLVNLGFTATTSPMGAKKWKESFNNYFIGAEVVILPDNDKVGKEHADLIAEQLIQVAKSVRIVELDGLEEKGDVSDWVSNGGTKEELLRIVDGAKEYEKLSSNVNNVDDSSQMSEVVFSLTDLGNAKRFVFQHGANIRYCYQAGNWIYWDGNRWRFDDSGEMLRLAKKTAESIYEDIYNPKSSDRSSIIEWAETSQSGARIREMIKLAESEYGMQITLEELDSNQWLLNCQNGVIDLKTGELLPHEKQYFMTRIAPIDYLYESKSEVFENFLETVIPDTKIRKFVQRAMGYSLSGDVGEEKLFFAFGVPASGKSTLLNAVCKVLGDYAAITEFESFISKPNGNSGPRNDLARLVGKRFVMGSEIENGKKMDTGLVKQLTGGDSITARFLHKEFFEFKPVFKLWLASNYQPKIDADDLGMWRRVVQIPFMNQIPEEKRDPKVKQELGNLQKTGPAILAWMVEGCLEWQKKGLGIPEEVVKSTKEYRESMDPLKDFIEDCCLINPLAKVENSELWVQYEEWCEANGERGKLGRKTFKNKLELRGFIQERTSTSRYWKGLKLIPQYKNSKKDDCNEEAISGKKLF